MSQPPQDPHGYPWGPPEPAGASPQQPAGASPQQGAPGPGAPQPSGRDADPYGGGQYGGEWTQQADQAAQVQQPYTGVPHGSAQHGSAQHGAAPYGSAPYGSSPVPGSYGPYGSGQLAGAPPARHGAPASTIVLLVVGGLSVLSGVLFLAGVAPVVLAILALVRSGHDPAGARRLTRIGWIVYAVVAVLLLVVVVALIALAVSRAGTVSGDPGGISALGALTGVLA